MMNWNDFEKKLKRAFKDKNKEEWRRLSTAYNEMVVLPTELPDRWPPTNWPPLRYADSGGGTGQIKPFGIDDPDQDIE